MRLQSDSFPQDWRILVLFWLVIPLYLKGTWYILSPFVSVVLLTAKRVQLIHVKAAAVNDLLLNAAPVGVRNDRYLFLSSPNGSVSTPSAQQGDICPSPALTITFTALPVVLP